LIAVCVLCFAVIPIALWIIVRFGLMLIPARIGESQITPMELLATMLAGLTISIGILAVMIAGLALWGYREIKREARRIAIEAAKRAAVETVNSPKIKDILRAEARTVIEAERAERKYGEELASAQPPQASTIETEASGEKVGRPRPRKKGG